jgi:serine/threonine-protein kinase
MCPGGYDMAARHAGAEPGPTHVTPPPFWKRDWLLGLALAALVGGVHQAGLVDRLDGLHYDAAMRATDRVPSDRIAIIAVDDASLASIGRWPWSRDVHAALHDKLSAGGARVVANLAFFSEPERDRGADTITRLADEYRRIVPAGAPLPEGPLGRIGAILGEAEKRLDADGMLADALARAGNTILPIVFRLDAAASAGRPDRPLPAWLDGSTLRPAGAIPGAAHLPLPAAAVTSMPIEPIGRAAAGVGHLNALADADGVYRASPLVVSYYGQVFPSLALAVTARALNLRPADIGLDYGAPVRLGGRRIATADHVHVRPHYYRAIGGRPPFQVDSFHDVHTGRIPPTKYRDRIVLVGATATGLAPLLATPADAAATPVTVLANEVSSLLEQHLVTVPPWAPLATLGAFVAVALYVMFVLGRLSAYAGAIVSGLFLAVLLAAPFVMLERAGTWLALGAPALLLALGHAVSTTRRYLATEAGKADADAESAESNRMLGLAYQAQGQLDLAFDKLGRAPVTAVLADNLYGLALDFERKRQFNKAEAVFRHIADAMPNYRDVAARLERARQLSETVILGSSTPDFSLTVANAGVEKPMLGRYRIERELGRGAMGAVYLGVDPRIGRQVALKTVALAREFAGDELEDARARFFREAETAGRLQHPDIVTIFDAGEEHDLAYIAMELLQGRDLAQYIRQGELLPLATVATVTARVADALDYAHRQRVVHRDVKPGNIMYDAATGQVKVTDFGIARITDASRTRTGIVLGTPSYMSPEQLAGKHVDGRSDLFSLGVTLFQLAAGRLPFAAESMAGLMYKITHEATPDIRAFRADVPAELAAILLRALDKDPDARFQTGRELAVALHAFAALVAPADVTVRRAALAS